MRGLLKDRGIERIYILGAGFSAPLGMPLTNDLLKLTHAVARCKLRYNNGNPYKKGEAEWLLQELSFYFPLLKFSHEKIEQGEIFEGFDIERFLSYALAISAFGEDFSNGGDRFVSSLKSWIGEAIWRKQIECMKNKIPEQYFHFLDTLNYSLIFTFNWDTVVETFLDRACIKYDYGLSSAYKKSGIPIIKLHGSIDWFLNPWIKSTNVKTELIRELDQPSDLNEEEKIHKVTQDLRYFYENTSTLNYPLLVIPGYDKISQVKKLGNMWKYLWSCLQDDLEVIIIGFSLRPDDYHSRAIFYPQLVYDSKAGRLKVKVLDYAQDEDTQKNIRARYEGVENCQFWFDGFNEKVFEEFIDK